MKAIPLSRINYHFPVDRDGEINEQPSKTTPDQTMSLGDMLARYSRGQAVPTFDPVYDGDEDMPDISTMSKIELQELRQDVLGEIQYQRYQLERKTATKAAKESKPAAAEKSTAAKRLPPPKDEAKPE